MKISGVYKITNKITGDFYIGSSKDVKKRWSNHKCPSKWTDAPGMLLYQAFQQYGVNKFVFAIIEETDDLKSREQYYIGILKPFYNNRNANGLDIERQKETKRTYSQSEKYKEAQRKYEQSEKRKEAKKKYQKSERGREVRRKYNQSGKGKECQRRYYSKLCLYNGETLTLSALRHRLKKAGIEHPTIEARMYLIDNN